MLLDRCCATSLIYCLYNMFLGLDWVLLYGMYVDLAHKVAYCRLGSRSTQIAIFTHVSKPSIGRTISAEGCVSGLTYPSWPQRCQEIYGWLVFALLTQVTSSNDSRCVALGLAKRQDY